MASRVEMRIALIAAGSALAGSALGVVGSVWVNERNLDHDRQIRLEDRRAEVYGKLLGLVQKQKNELDSLPQLRPQDLTVRSNALEYLELLRKELDRIQALASELAEPVALVQVYGSFKALGAAWKLQDAMLILSSQSGLSDVLSLPQLKDYGPQLSKLLKKAEDGLEKARTEALAALNEFLNVMREDVGPKGFE